ncbi:hypothetical protein [Nocardia carnea]|uniref:hypothetical protein n=1 Tax=Nocardia carnea TaxID=37328 RepID=UPI0012DEB8F7|nr:hypothetical protein [Nocardia carnea]
MFEMLVGRVDTFGVLQVRRDQCSQRLALQDYQGRFEDVDRRGEVRSACLVHRRYLRGAVFIISPEWMDVSRPKLWGLDRQREVPGE